jgi:hypothetical protein
MAGEGKRTAVDITSHEFFLYNPPSRVYISGIICF